MARRVYLRRKEALFAYHFMPPGVGDYLISMHDRCQAMIDGMLSNMGVPPEVIRNHGPQAQPHPEWLPLWRRFRPYNDSAFVREVERALRRRWGDPSRWNVSPFPVQYQQLGGDDVPQT